VTNKLSLSQAVYIGLASMLGAGVFVVFGPAAAQAGSLLWLAVLIAGLVAYLNAGSIAQLARVVTRSGGAYSYARHYLNPTWGFTAGAAFLIGKLGSVAAVALTFASYLTPGYEVLVASLAIILMTLINIWGINRTAFGARVLATITLSFLSFVVLYSMFMPGSAGRLEAPEPIGVFTAAAMMFFAFAGYARVSTLGSEVDNPTKTIPKAIGISFGIVLVIYLLLAALLSHRLGAQLAFTVTPIADLFPEEAGPAVSIFAATAALGSLLALIAGMSRTAATMAEDGELPKVLARLNSKSTPFVAEWLIAGLAIALVATGSFVFVIGLSSFAVLTYYAIANLAAIKQPKTDSSRSKVLSILGMILCLALALSVPPFSLIVGGVVLMLVLMLRTGLAKLR
jgi:APA family basic amino acid/polyamine antiporter